MWDKEPEPRCLGHTVSRDHWERCQASAFERNVRSDGQGSAAVMFASMLMKLAAVNNRLTRQRHCGFQLMECGTD